MWLQQTDLRFQEQSQSGVLLKLCLSGSLAIQVH